MSAPARRLFFALWPDGDARRALAAAARPALAAAGGRAVPEANLHVTLAFLGNVAEPRLGALRAVAERVAGGGAHGAPRVALHFDRLEHWARPQIIVAVGAAPSMPAQALAEELKSATAAAGFLPDLKPFQAHVTLARKVSRAADTQLSQRVSWSFDGFALVESRSDGGAVSYSVVDSYALVGAQNQHVQG